AQLLTESRKELTGAPSGSGSTPRFRRLRFIRHSRLRLPLPLVGQMGLLLPCAAGPLFFNVVVMPMMTNVGVLHSLHDYVAVLQLRSDPMPPRLFAYVERRTASAEGVQHHVAGPRRNLHRPIDQLGRQLVGLAILTLELPMADGRDVLPDV